VRTQTHHALSSGNEVKLATAGVFQPSPLFSGRVSSALVAAAATHAIGQATRSDNHSKQKIVRKRGYRFSQPAPIAMFAWSCRCPVASMRFMPSKIAARAFPVPIESERGSKFYFNAFSSREPASTSLENALVTPRVDEDSRSRQPRASSFIIIPLGSVCLHSSVMKANSFHHVVGLGIAAFPIKKEEQCLLVFSNSRVS
jgi:hypothetical protein